jgi:prophage tail gpP-like protein
VIVPGWRDIEGKLWQPNHLVFVESPYLKISGDMLIQHVDLHQLSTGNSKGTIAEIQLCHPLAFKGSAGKATKTDQEWGYL